MRQLPIFALAALTLAVATAAGAVSPYPVTELFPAEPGRNAERGFAVAVDGDWLAVGAPRDDRDPERRDAGSVYLFQWSGTTWDQKAKLFAGTPRQGALLGFSLAMRDGVLAAGAPGEGVVYIFVRQEDDAWEQAQTLRGARHGAGAFGRSLALDADRLAVGAFGAHGTVGGAVYLYQAGSWEAAPITLQPRVRQKGERFGAAVSLAGNVLVAGAPGHDSGAGAVYVFRWQGTLWEQEAKLPSPDSPPLAGDQLGAAVATDGTEIFAGAPTADSAGPNSGVVYQFVQAAGVWTAQRLEVEAAPEDQLGSSLALSADLLVVGAPAPPPGTGTGGIRVLRRTGVSWERPVPGNAETRDLAGFAVAVSGERVVVSGVLGDQRDGAAGAAWSFDCSAEACTQEAEAVARDDLLERRLGVSVALTKDLMAVGAPESGASVTGAVYLYRKAKDGWRQEERLTSDYRGDGFGSSVALEGSLLAIGAPQARSAGVSGDPTGYPNGSVDLFVRRGGVWSFEITLAPPAAHVTSSAFGTSVAIADGIVAVGAPGNSSVYLFERGTQGWTSIHQFFGFGSTVSFRGGVLAIGGSGAVSLFAREASGSTFQDMRFPNLAIGAAAAFGAAVAVDDGIIAVGAPGFEGDTGAVLLFEKEGETWKPTSQLSYSYFIRHRFGSSVALLGNRLVVGAPSQGGLRGNDWDMAALFERRDGVWKQVADLDALLPPDGDEFGAAVALSEDFLVVTSPGAPRADRVTVFDLRPPEGGDQ